MLPFLEKGGQEPSTSMYIGVGAGKVARGKWDYTPDIYPSPFSAPQRDEHDLRTHAVHTYSILYNGFRLRRHVYIRTSTKGSLSQNKVRCKKTS